MFFRVVALKRQRHFLPLQIKYFKLHNYQVKAAGILFYQVLEDGTVQLLLRNSKEKGFADLGGKIEDCDRDIYDIAAREAWEESNKVFDVDELQRKIRNQEGYYIVASKYCMFYCEISHHNTKEFGNVEVFRNQTHEF